MAEEKKGLGRSSYLSQNLGDFQDQMIIAGKTNNGKEIRTAELSFKQWPVSDESRERYSKKQDYDLRLDIGKAAQEYLAQTNPEMASRLKYKDAAYDRELAKQVLPYIGVAYDIHPQNLPPEEVPTATTMPAEGDDDLPF